MYPKVTVLMPVYNSERYVSEAIESILNQTFKDFEFLIYNDGSTDRSDEVIRSFQDNRIIYISFPNNQGYLKLLNLGLENANSPFVARMDSDDIALPNRLEVQYNFLIEHPNIAVCGSWCKFIGNINHVNKMPTSYLENRIGLFYGTPITHPTAMFNNKIFKENNFKYDEDFYTAEDYELFWRISLQYEIINIPEVLLNYRIHANQIGSACWYEQRITKQRIQAKVFFHVFTQKHVEDLNWLSNFFMENIAFTNDWLNKIEYFKSQLPLENQFTNVYPQDVFLKVVNNIFEAKVKDNIKSYFNLNFFHRKQFNPNQFFRLLLHDFFSFKYFTPLVFLKFTLKCFIFYRK